MTNMEIIFTTTANKIYYFDDKQWEKSESQVKVPCVVLNTFWYHLKSHQYGVGIRVVGKWKSYLFEQHFMQ